MCPERVDGHDQLAGDTRAVELAREQPEHRQLSLAQGLDERLPAWPFGHSIVESLQNAARVGRETALLGGSFEQVSHGGAFVQEDADVTLRLGKCECSIERLRGGGTIAGGSRGEGAQNEQLNDAAVPSAIFGRLQEPVDKTQCRLRVGTAAVELRSGGEHSGEGDVLELAQVGELIIGRETAVSRPGVRVLDAPVAKPESCAKRRDGPNLREEITA